jgi:hypothetical protein
MCIDIGGLFSSGCSQETKIDVTSEQTNKNITNVLIKNSQSSSSNTQIRQDMNFKNTGEINCGSEFSMTQKIDAKVKIITQITEQCTTEVKQSLHNSLDEAMKNQSKAVTEILGKAINSNTTTTVKNQLDNIIENSITRDSLQAINDSVALIQTQTIVNEGKMTGSSCKFDQFIVFRLIANRVMTMINQVATNDESLNEARVQLAQEDEKQSKGVNDVVATVGKTVEGVAVTAGKAAESISKSFFQAYSTIFIVIGIVVVVGAFLLVFIFMKSTSKSSRSQMMNQGLSMVGGQYPGMMRQVPMRPPPPMQSGYSANPYYAPQQQQQQNQHLLEPAYHEDYSHVDQQQQLPPPPLIEQQQQYQGAEPVYHDDYSHSQQQIPPVSPQSPHQLSAEESHAMPPLREEDHQLFTPAALQQMKQLSTQKPSDILKAGAQQLFQPGALQSMSNLAKSQVGRQAAQALLKKFH